MTINADIKATTTKTINEYKTLMMMPTMMAMMESFHYGLANPTVHNVI